MIVLVKVSNEFSNIFPAEVGQSSFLQIVDIIAARGFFFVKLLELDDVTPGRHEKRNV